MSIYNYIIVRSRACAFDVAATRSAQVVSDAQVRLVDWWRYVSPGTTASVLVVASAWPPSVHQRPSLPSILTVDDLADTCSPLRRESANATDVGMMAELD